MGNHGFVGCAAECNVLEKYLSADGPACNRRSFDVRLCVPVQRRCFHVFPAVHCASLLRTSSRMPCLVLVGIGVAVVATGCCWVRPLRRNENKYF